MTTNDIDKVHQYIKPLPMDTGPIRITEVEYYILQIRWVHIDIYSYVQETLNSIVVCLK